MNKGKVGQLLKGDAFRSVLASVIAALLGLLAGLIFMICINPGSAWDGFLGLIEGGFRNGARGMGNVLFYSTPIMMTGLSVGFAFKTGLFNIGATGQYTMGLFFSIMTAYYLHGNWFVCILAGILGGMLWGFIPGLLKALFNVSEVITSIMTNYIGMFLVDMVIRGSSIAYDREYARTFPVPDAANIPKVGLDKLFPASYANGGIMIAIVMAIVVYIVLNKMNFGFELKACGMNKHAARYAGINQNMKIILSMVIAGGLAGLGGALQIQAGAGCYYAPINALQTYGFDGIAVALLGSLNPIGIIFAGMFLAHVERGGLVLQSLGFSPDIVDIIIGVIIYFSAFALIFKNAIPKIIRKINKRKAQKSTAQKSIEQTSTEQKVTEQTSAEQTSTEHVADREEA